MRRTLGVTALVLALLAMAVPVAGQVVEGTCDDLGFTSMEESVSGVWGSITFDPTSPTLTLVVEEGYEVNICVKAGSVNQGDGPEDLGTFGEGTHLLSHSSLKELSHFGFSFDELPTTTTSSTTSTTTTTSTTSTTTTTTLPDTTTTGPTSTTAPPTPTQFCVDVNTASQAELEQLGGVSALLALAIIANRPYESVSDLLEVVPPGVLLLILAVNAQTGAFASDTCLTTETTTTTVPGGTTTTVPGSTTLPGETTTTPTLTIPPEPFVFGAAATVCVAEVPTIRIEFGNTFPELAGEVGILTMADIDGNVVSTQELVYEPNTTVDLLYPGTSVNADGTIDDVPGWILTDSGLWIPDPSDDFLRDGINLTYTVNPTATAFVTYPPESSECANPDNPTGSAPPPGAPRTPSPGDGELPFTGLDSQALGWLAIIAAVLGGLFLLTARGGDEDDARAASTSPGS